MFNFFAHIIFSAWEKVWSCCGRLRGVTQVSKEKQPECHWCEVLLKKIYIFNQHTFLERICFVFRHSCFIVDIGFLSICIIFGRIIS